MGADLFCWAFSYKLTQGRLRLDIKKNQTTVCVVREVVESPLLEVSNSYVDLDLGDVD